MKKYLLSFFICIQTISFASENSKNDTLRILVSSIAEQNPAILTEFLQSLKDLKEENLLIDYFFIDDNNIEESSHLLKAFRNDIEANCLILSSQNDIKYLFDNEKTLDKNEKEKDKKSIFKDLMIQKANLENYDFLFLIDSDILLHPQAIHQLLKAKKDIISNVYQIKSSSDSKPHPQYENIDKNKKFDQNFNFLNQETIKNNNDFLNIMKKPGVYEVDSLKGNILISKNALKKGVSFQKIKKLTILEEDYHFCLRATVLGLSLFIDSHFPALYIKNEKDLIKVKKLKNDFNVKTPRITLSMVIHNEANRYLRKVLEKAKEYITDAVIIDDASTDDSAEICLDILKGIPLHLIINSKIKFSHEVNLRKQQWEETIKTNPDWIINLDADEVFEDNFKDKIHDIINSKDFDAIAFRIYDFWDENHYRDDQYWLGSHYYYIQLIRYIPDIEYYWLEKPQHCGRFPQNIHQFKKHLSDLRMKHYGWAKYEDRLEKYQRYQKYDPDFKYGWKEQYESILDENPNLIKWIE
ncbi:MAG: hypothetical protein K1060chlam1_00623 [Candidatus Anoxychlamydiales bacterium]|nr:hypothetical protein [Candidatus Anoxychlamydiales bacterium]